MYKPPTKKQIEAFRKEVLAAFERLGIKLEDNGASYSVETVAGKLDLNVYDDWIACRFDDVAQAKNVVGSGCLNQFSGKWNWMGRDCVPEFERGTRSLLPA